MKIFTFTLLKVLRPFINESYLYVLLMIVLSIVSVNADERQEFIQEFTFSDAPIEVTSGIQVQSPGMEGDRIFFSGSSLVVNFTVDVDLDADNTSVAVMLYNSSWKHIIPAEYNNISKLWGTEIQRIGNAGLSYAEKDWFPKEQWTLKLTIQTIDQILTSSTVVTDVLTEPLLQWDLGEWLGTRPIERDVQATYNVVQDVVYVTTSPCAPDVALVGYVKDGDVHLGRTFKGFVDSSVAWFKIPASQLCGQGCDMKLFDVRMTNHRVFLVSNHGLFMSEDLRNSSAEDTVLSFTKVVKPGCILVEATLGYTATCQFRQNEIFRGDLVTHTFSCTGVDRAFLYNIDGFDQWYTVTLPGGQEILDAAYHVHLDALTFLVKKSSTTAVYTYRFEEGVLKTKARFPPHVFPVSSQLKRLHYHPISQNLYAVGKEIYLSDDGGNSFQLVTRLEQKSVVQVFFTPSDIYMRLGDGGLLYGKTGLIRMVDVGKEVTDFLTPNPYYAVHVDRLGVTHAVQLIDTGTVIVKDLNISGMIQSNKLTSDRALGYQLIRRDEAVLFEYSENSTVSFFSNASVGQEIKYKDGGYGFISRVSKSRNPHFLSTLFIDIQVKFAVARKELSRENSIEVQDLDLATHEATLVLNPGTVGWEATDLHYTVVLPMSSNFFLTKFIDATHFRAVAIIPVPEYTTHDAYEWMLMDFTASDMWLEEAPCKYKLTIDEELSINTVFELDVEDTVNLTLVSSLVDMNYRESLKKPHHLATFTNPWQFEVVSSSVEVNTVITLNILVKCVVLRRGVSAVRVTLPFASHRCDVTAYMFTFYAGCPCSKKLTFHYPVNISHEQYLHGNPMDNGYPVLEDLPVNYRPPSELGIRIPTNDHIYNADPAEPRKELFQISKRTGHYKQCAGAKNKAECGCTEEMELSSLASFSDCKRRVHRMIHEEELNLALSIERHSKPSMFLTKDHLIILEEINDRIPLIESMTRRGSVLEKITSNEELNFGNETLYDPTELKVTLNGSGLYHFRLTLVPGYSFCSLQEEFQIYVHSPPLAYPINYLLNFSAAIICGGVLFAIYMVYLTKRPPELLKTKGSMCRNIDAMNSDTSTRRKRVVHQPSVRRRETIEDSETAIVTTLV